MKKKLSIVVLTLVAFAGFFAFGKNISREQIMFINEVRSWDSDVTRTGYYGSDYIELYNASSEEVSLEGWYVSDDMTDLKKCQIHEVVIAGNDYALLYANGKNNSGASLNFKINPAGEKIFLSDAEGNLIDSIYVPEQEFGTVYARVTDGAQEWAVMESSIGYSNNESKMLPLRTLDEPVFSHESGFYDEAFTLTLEANKGETIYYTLDGSEPTEESLVYEDGIVIEDISDQPNVLNSVRNVVQDWEEYTPSETPVDKATVVRAIAMDKDGNVSEVGTNTYYVGVDKYQNKTVVSLVSDFDEMFGDNGIFVTGKDYEEGTAETPNFLQSGRRWEIQGNMEILEDGEIILNQEVGIRTQGASTRLASKKKMSIYSREEYSGSTYFDGLTLGDKNIHSVYTNHSVSNIVFPDLIEDRALDTQEAMECVVFLNGEYWYKTYLLEKYNKYYLAEKYQVNPDNVIIIKDDEATEGPDDAYDYYLDILRFAEITDLSVDENYEELKQRIDVQSYIDYICTNLYLCNMDISETKNMTLWRTIEDEGTEMGDTRWRWMIYDMDCLEWMDKSYYGAEERAAINSFTEVMQFTGMAIDEHQIYASAKKNEEFCKQFVLTFMDMANVNFSVENIEKTFEKWNVTTEEFGDFFEHRFDYIVPYMAEEFGLTGTLEEVTLKVNDTEGGTILLNTTTPDISDGSWTGKYYTDYPVTVTAVPEEGYEFGGWGGSVTSDSATMEAEVTAGGITLEAVFEETAN